MAVLGVDDFPLKSAIRGPGEYHSALLELSRVLLRLLRETGANGRREWIQEDDVHQVPAAFWSQSHVIVMSCHVLFSRGRTKSGPCWLVEIGDSHSIFEHNKRTECLLAGGTLD